MKAKTVTVADLQREKDRRRKQREFTTESVAGNHGQQLKYLKSTAPFTLALCSRRAGKSFAGMALLALNAMARKNVTCLYIGLTERSVRLSIISKIWNRLVRRYDLPFTDVNADLAATCTTTGSVVRFGSADNVGNIEAFRGDDLAGGIVLIDECQSVALNVIETLVEDIIIPSLSSTTDEHPESGRLILSGTIPTTPHGYFYRQWADESKSWDRHNWNRFDNPFLKNQRAQLDVVLEKLQVSENHPRIRRDWFGELTFDENETTYRYVSARSTYVPREIHRIDINKFHCTFAVLDDLDRLIIGIDPAQKRDRFAFTGFAYHSRRRDKLLQVLEAVTDPGADPHESEWLEILKHIKARYSFVHKVVRDPGSSTPTNDLLQHSHGITVESAIKGPGSLKARVDIFADLLARGICLVIKDGELDKDLQIARWDPNELEKGRYRFDKAVCSPDIADSASYIVPFFTILGAKPIDAKVDSETQYWARETEKHLAKLWSDSAKQAKRRKVRPPGVAASLYRQPPDKR